MSNEIETESLSNGATRVMEESIEPSDPDIIRQNALDHRMNDDSRTLLPRKRSADDLLEGDCQLRLTKKQKVRWTHNLEHRFLEAIDSLGFENAQPKKILKHMNVKTLTREQVASHLQKYRLHVKAVRAQVFRDTNARNMPSNYGLRSSRRYKSNLGSQLGGYGLGQSSLMMNNNVGVHSYGSYVNNAPNHYGLNQSGSSLLPTVNEEKRGVFGTSQGYHQVPEFGEYGIPSSAFGMNPYPASSLGFRNGLYEERSVFGTSQVGGYGQYGLPNNVLGVNSAPPPPPSIPKGKRPLNGERRNISRASQAHRVPQSRQYGITNSVSGMNSNPPSSLGYLENWLLNEETRSFSGPSQAPGIGQNGMTSSVLGMNYYPPTTYIGMRVRGNDILVGPRETNVTGYGNVNGSLGESSSAMNWNFINNMSIPGSSSTPFPSTYSSLLANDNQIPSHFFAETDGVVPVLENPSMYNDHDGINEVFSNPPANQYKDKRKEIAETVNVSLDYDIEMNDVIAAYPLDDIANWNFDNLEATSDDEILDFIAAPTEMHLPTNDMDMINQEHGFADSTQLPLLVDEDYGFTDSTQLPLPVDEEHGSADRIQLPLSVDEGLISNEDFMNFMNESFPHFV